MTQLRTLGKYHILEKLAGGPLAEIYKAKTVGIAGFEKVQVLHRITPHYARDPAFVRAFIEQAKLAFSLNHRNIVQVFEFGKVDGDLFLATEYIPGLNLSDVLTHATSLQHVFPVGLTCYLMSEVAAGLEYSHNKTDQTGAPVQVLHCGLDPHNVACSWEGSVKILEFGLAGAAWLAAHREDRISALPRYLAPEQLDDGPISRATDIFAFGAIMWELLAGRPLFGGKNREQVFQAIREAPIPALRTINREVPPELEELTDACLQREASDRLRSAGELHTALLQTQREVGAVIGSRTLATLLGDFFSEQSETRDVRQQWPSAATRLAPVRSAATIRHLVDAAAEVAAPRNPPAGPVRGDRARPRHRSPQPGSESSVEPDRMDASASAAGVLRAPRHPDEDVSTGTHSAVDVPYLHSAELVLIEQEEAVSATQTVGTSSPPAQEILAGSRSDDGFDEPSGLLDPDDLPVLSVDVTPARLQDRPMAPVTGDAADPAGQTDADDAASASSPGRVVSPLREKKRFIAAYVLLDGPAAARRDALALIEDIAFKLDGLVHLRDSDRLVALFGLPTTDENDVVSAVRFAFDAQDAVAHLATPPTTAAPGEAERSDETLLARVGIRSGTARLSDRPYRDAYQLQGNVLQETLLLTEHAPDGQIHVAGAAARLASMHYVLREVGALRSRRKPVRCYRIVAAQPSQRRDSAENPLVGREIEVKALRSAWRETVLSGGQRTVLIIGDAGVGKSRLIDELLLRHCSDARVTVATATPHHRDSANGLLVDLLCSIGGEWQTTSPRSRTRLLERLRGLLRGESPEQCDELIEAAAAVIDPSQSNVGSAADFNRRRVYQVMRSVLNAAAARRPLVVVVEDVHWADSSSLECIRALVQRPRDAQAPTFVLVTARPEDGFEADGLVPSADGSQVSLEELDEGDRRELIIQSLSGESAPQLIDEIERRARGNPFYIRELCQVLSEMPFKTVSDIPATVQGVIVSRVDRLPPLPKLVLQHAAVVGPAFRESILAALLGRNPARPLADLRNSGFLLPAVSMAAQDESSAGQSEQFEREWTFRHMLVQEVVYESLSGADRRSLHARVGEIMSLRTVRGSSDAAAEVGRHLELGGQADLAAEHYLTAAAAAAAGYANKEAERLYQRALELGHADAEKQYRACAGLERIHGRLGLAEKQAEDLQALALLCNGDAARLADLRVRQAMRLLRVGELYLALEAAEQAQDSAKTANDEILRAEALRLAAEAYERLNDYPRATAAVEEAIGVFEGNQAPSRLARAQIGMGRILLARARYDEAFEHFSPALTLVEQTGNRWLARVLRNNLAVVHYCRGNLTRALVEASSSLKLCVAFGDRAREGDIATVLGIISLALGAYENARRHLDRALALHRDTGSRWSEAETLVYAGLLRVERRDIRGAVEVLEASLRSAERMGARYIAISARNALALALCQRGSESDSQRAVDEATRAFEKARAAALIVGEIPGLSRAARATAQLNQLDKARALSRRAVELLGAQRHIEGPEQEVYYTHFRILQRLDDPSAADYLSMAHQIVTEKLDRLKDPAHRSTFSEAVRLNAAILRDHQRGARRGS